MSILGEILYVGGQVWHKQTQENEKTQELLDNAKTLEDISVQANSYNKEIPIVFGTVNLAGNVIWTGKLTSYLLKEGGATMQDALYDKYFGSKIKQTRSTNASFSMIYNLDFAIGICEGTVDKLLEVKADNKTLDLQKYKYRFYNGSKMQNPDPLIEETQGVGKTPAFRNLCYIVFEDFPISDFSNSIPNFVFTIERNIISENNLGQNVKAITLIPGTGEFVYHTEKIAKYSISYGDILLKETATPMNYHNNESKANVLVALDNLKKDLQNVEWVSVVVCWFANGLDIASASIYPACEFRSIYEKTAPYDWAVANKTRQNAKVIDKDVNGNPLYGGTPSDSSVISLITELKNRGYKVCLYPIIMVEMQTKPWRGRITGQSMNISNFFEKTDGYKNFIRHYANLAKNKVDAFIIGSELIGLTKINDGSNNFPAVDKLCEVAGEVRQIMGQGVKLTYAADWSEYHHTDGGFYNMDKLWANSNIDFIGIDAYFPLTDKTSKPSIDEIKNGWQSGEGWDFYYNSQRTQKLPLTKEWAWKNIKWFVENVHINSDGKQTQWQPNMKKVWFCEYGFPSVDLCTNQPNVFYDPTSSANAFPRKSQGYVDFSSQADAILATEKYWEGSDSVVNKFLWTWDARPYPFFPSLKSIWSDSSVWKYGHWVCGKVNYASVASIIEYCFKKAGIKNYQVLNVNGVVNGMVVSGKKITDILKSIMLAYNVVIYEENGVVIANSLQNLEVINCENGAILIDEIKREVLDKTLVKNGDNALKHLTLFYYDVENDSQIRHVYAEDGLNTNGLSANLTVPFMLSFFTATELVKKALMMLNQRINRVVSIENNNNAVTVGSLIKINDEQSTGLVTEIHYDGLKCDVHISLVSNEALQSINAGVTQETTMPILQTVAEMPKPELEIIDTNNFTNVAITEGTFALWFAFKNVPLAGASVYYSLDDASYIKMFDCYQNSIIGEVISQDLQDININLQDNLNKITVALHNKNTIFAVNNWDFLSYANLCLIGNQLMAFQNVTKISDSVYELSNFIHGRFGTNFESKINGAKFIHLQKNVRQFAFPISVNKIYFKIVANGDIIEEMTATEFYPQKNSIKKWQIDYVEQKTIGDDILFSWKERYDVISQYFARPKTYLQHFTININNKRIVNLYGQNEFLYTKAMQNEDGANGNIIVSVYF
jgi:hypothetical protein